MANIYDQFDEAPAATPSRPGANPYDQFDAPPSPSFAAQAWDVAKQIPSGLVAGAEAVAAFPAHAAGFVGGLAEQYVPDLRPDIPGFVTPASPEGAQRRQELLDLIKQQGGAAGIAQYLPTPQTTAGQFARTGAEFIPAVAGAGRATAPAAVFGKPLSAPRAIGVGATAGLTSEAGGQLTEGTALEPYFRVGGALVAGPVAGRLAEGAATRAAIKNAREGVRKEADAGFQQFRDAGFGIHPDEAVKYSRNVRSELYQGGRTDVTAPDTWKALEGIEGRPFTTPQDYQAAYQTLGNVAKDAAKSSDRMAANIAQERLLGVLENMNPSSVVSQIATGADPRQAVAVFQKANQNWAALKRAENIDRRIAAGELRAGSNYSGLNLENELRRRVGVLADPNIRGGFSPSEQQQFEQFAKGTLRSNAPRYVKNILGGGGGLGALAAGTAGFGGGAYYGFDPATGLGLATLGGLGLAKYGNMRALNRARELELMLLQRSPYAARTGVGGTRAGAPLTTLAPTLSTLGE